MKIATLVWGACGLFLLLVSPAETWSQGFQGTIRGDVQDPSGALIPGVTVTVTNTGTGETRTQFSSESGSFNFPNLLVSAYTVTVELPGFKKYTRENIEYEGREAPPPGTYLTREQIDADFDKNYKE